jgi:hypothetical protein
MMPQVTNRRVAVMVAIVVAAITVVAVVVALLVWWPAEPARQPVPDDHDTSGTSVERPSTSRWPDERASSAEPQW